MITLNWVTITNYTSKAIHGAFTLYAHSDGAWTVWKGNDIAEAATASRTGCLSDAKTNVMKAFYTHYSRSDKPRPSVFRGLPEEQDNPRIIMGIPLTSAQAARWDALQEVAIVLDKTEGWMEKACEARAYCIAQCVAVLTEAKENPDAL